MIEIKDRSGSSRKIRKALAVVRDGSPQCRDLPHQVGGRFLAYAASVPIGAPPSPVSFFAAPSPSVSLKTFLVPLINV
jgi:hypothetical protein